MKNHIPARWLEVLHQLQTGGFPEAIIAGGALRDIDNGKPVKDVDIFVLAQGAETKARLEKAFGYEGVALIEIDTPSEYETWTSDVCAVYNFAHDGAFLTDMGGGTIDDPTSLEVFVRAVELPDFQVVVIERSALRPGGNFGEYVIKDFDLGICRIWTDGVGIYKSPEYINDHAAKTMTVVRCPNEAALKRTITRIGRLSRKYPDYEAKNVEVQS